jgi:hypothetical protein
LEFILLPSFKGNILIIPAGGIACIPQRLCNGQVGNPVDPSGRRIAIAYKRDQWFAVIGFMGRGLLDAAAHENGTNITADNFLVTV